MSVPHTGGTVCVVSTHGVSDRPQKLLRYAHVRTCAHNLSHGHTTFHTLPTCNLDSQIPGLYFYFSGTGVWRVCKCKTRAIALGGGHESPNTLFPGQGLRNRRSGGRGGGGEDKATHSGLMSTGHSPLGSGPRTGNTEIDMASVFNVL